ncbi:MAG: hypothetical protein LKM43_05825 [Wolbachia endosymbiont of Penenirmus auritus]|nr:hypothetical protein [Wolbachia endosymbiont of Penenirmus auritus]
MQLKRSKEIDDHRFNNTSAIKQIIAAWYSLQKHKMLPKKHDKMHNCNRWKLCKAA